MVQVQVWFHTAILVICLPQPHNHSSNAWLVTHFVWGSCRLRTPFFLAVPKSDSFNPLAGYEPKLVKVEGDCFIALESIVDPVG